MLHTSTQASIDRWISEAPNSRRVESEPLANDVWETKAFEGSQVVYEEVDLETDVPVLRLLAAWCDQQPKLEPRPLAKTTGAFADAPAMHTGSRDRRL